MRLLPEPVEVSKVVSVTNDVLQKYLYQPHQRDRHAHHEGQDS